MKKILGIDLGVSSIGWAYIHLATSKSEQSQIVGSGVRIIPLSSDEKDEFSKGNAITTNQQRRVKRGARRNLYRYRIRRAALNAALQSMGMLPGIEWKDLSAIELYGLRDRALREPLSLPEIGRIFQHMNQRRGYKSNRKAENNSDSKEDSLFLEQIARRENEIRESGLTPGQYFFKQLSASSHYRVKEKIFSRQSNEKEFRDIWKFQSVFYPGILTVSAMDKICDDIIFKQRPLKSKKGQLSNCEFEVKYRVIPKSSPIFQLSRIWQNINHLEIESKEGEKFPLSHPQRKILFDYLQNHEKISQKKILEITGFLPASDYSINLKRDLEGNITRCLIGKIIGFDHNLLAFDPYTEAKEMEFQPLFRLWHLIYSVEDPSVISRKLQNDYGFKSEVADALSTITFKIGVSPYGNLSMKAIRKILPHLENGLKYSEACEAVGYRHADYVTNEENADRQLDDFLNILEKGSLRSPVVEKILNQLVHLVNAILADPSLGRPDEIRVELARDLQKNNDERQKMDKNMRALEKEKKAIAEEIRNMTTIRYVSSKDIDKYRLWKEFDGVSPYEPHKSISLADLFNQNLYEIEHIIPRSRLFDNSFANKTIARRAVNSEKDNATAFDYMKGKGEQAFHDYLNCIHNNSKLSKTKKRYLLCSGDKIPQEFISRQLNETRFITRKAVSMLRSVCREVHTTSGPITDYLRHIWGMDTILKHLNIDKYRASNQTEWVEKYIDHQLHRVEEIKNWSKRDDHRHHAVDAIAIACTTNSHVHRLNNLNKEYHHYSALKQSGRMFELPWENFIQDSRHAIDKILVSFKPGKRVATLSKNIVKKAVIQKQLIPRGALHEETILGQIKRYRDTKVPLNKKFRPEWIEMIADPLQKNLVIQRYEESGKDMNLAFGNLDKEPIWLDDRKSKFITDVTLFEKIYTVRYKLDGNFTLPKAKSITDSRLRAQVLDRLEKYNNDPKKAFAEPLKDNNGRPVKSVRCLLDSKEKPALHTASGGITGDNGVQVDFVNTGNNHHIAIYENESGQRTEVVVTFWEAFERKRQGFEVIEREHPEFGKLLYSLQQNEMFVFDMEYDELEKSIFENNYEHISPHMYRVQKISGSYYVFRHHLETKLVDDNESMNAKKFIRISSPNSLKAIKVRINALGRIVKTGE